MVEEEGMETRASADTSAPPQALVEGLAPLGFEPLVEEAYRLPCSRPCACPRRVRRRGEAAVRRALLDRYGIEVGGGLGELAGRIWRIGLMGENARVINVEALLFALRKEFS